MPDTTEPDAVISDNDIHLFETTDDLESRINTQSSVKSPKTSWSFLNPFTRKTTKQTKQTAKIAVVNSPHIEDLLDITVPQDENATEIITHLNTFSKLFNEIQTNIVEANKASHTLRNNPTVYNEAETLKPYIMSHYNILKEIKDTSKAFENFENRKTIFKSEIIEIKDAYQNPNKDRPPGETTILSTIFGSDLRNDNHKYLYNFTFNRNRGEGPDFSFSDTVNNNTVSTHNKYGTPNIVFTNIFRLAHDEYTKAYDDVMTGTPLDRAGGRNKKTRKSKKLKKRKTLKKSKIGKKMKKRRTLKKSKK